MNGDKFAEIRQKIFSMQFVEQKSREPATEFSTAISSIETDIQRNIQVIERERRHIEQNFSAGKISTDTTLETISFPDTLNGEDAKIFEQQSELLRQVVAERGLLEKSFVDRKSSFAKKKAELHQKFLRKKFEGG